MNATNSAVSDGLLAGLRAHRAGRFEEALRSFDASISAALPETLGVPLADYGWVAPSADELLKHCTCRAALLLALLTRRAATALKMGLSLRALADSGAALVLTTRGHRPAFFRALALLSVGACAAAAQVLAPFAHPAQSTTRHLRRRTIGARALRAAALLRERRVVAGVAALSESPNVGLKVPRSLAYVHGALEITRMGDGKGRGWVATAPIPAGTVLVVEPAIFPTAPPQTKLDEASTLPLLQAVAKVIHAGGRDAARLREYLECLHPLEGEEDAVPMLRDQLAEPYVVSIGEQAGMLPVEVRACNLPCTRPFSHRLKPSGGYAVHGVTCELAIPPHLALLTPSRAHDLAGAGARP